MGLFEQSFPSDGAKERFAQLHFQAACVRLEMLMRILRAIEERGGVDQAPASLVLEAANAAAEVADNLRWASERLQQTARREESVRMDFPAGRTAPEPRSGFKDGGRPPGDRTSWKNVNG